MAHLYKTVEWQSGSGKWYVNDTIDLKSNASKWWAPLKMLNKSPSEFLKMLMNDFNINDASYSIESNVLVFSFSNQNDARKYKNWINAQARKYNLIL